MFPKTQTRAQVVTGVGPVRTEHATKREKKRVPSTFLDRPPRSGTQVAAVSWSVVTVHHARGGGLSWSVVGRVVTTPITGPYFYGPGTRTVQLLNVCEGGYLRG